MVLKKRKKGKEEGCAFFWGGAAVCILHVSTDPNHPHTHPLSNPPSPPQKPHTHTTKQISKPPRALVRLEKSGSGAGGGGGGGDVRFEVLPPSPERAAATGETAR